MFALKLKAYSKPTHCDSPLDRKATALGDFSCPISWLRHTQFDINSSADIVEAILTRMLMTLRKHLPLAMAQAQ